MFRPDRIGTPIFHDQDFVTSTVDFAFSAFTNPDVGFYMQAINTGLPTTYGRTCLAWAGTEAVAAGAKVGFGQQFTVTKPLKGTRVLCEVNGAFILPVSTKVLIQPFFGKLGSAAVSLLAAAPGQGGITPIGNAINPSDQPNATEWRTIRYKEQVVIAQGAPEGVYGHGIQLFTGANAWDCTSIHAICSVRMFNDLQAIEYQDPLR